MARHEVTEIRVRLAGRSYPVRVGSGLLGSPSVPWTQWIPSRRAWLITDSRVGPLHAPLLVRRLKAAGSRVHESRVPQGESSKSLASLERLVREGLARGLQRDCTILALGGGMVGDLAGLLAGVYLRGVSWLQLPTSLLAQVDASVGGKVAVNVGEWKNSLGLFLQPAAVLADVGALATLSPRQFRSGLAESIKMAAVLSPAEFRWLELNMGRIRRNPEPEILAQLVARSVRLKARVVEQDELDRGRRALLNFGHTLGHALEGATGYGRFLHGEAVAVGCAFAAAESVRAGVLAPGQARRLVDLLDAAGLPTSVRGVSVARLLKVIEGDKKQSSKGLAFVLTGPLGSGSVKRLASGASLRRSLEAFLGGDA